MVSLYTTWGSGLVMIGLAVLVIGGGEAAQPRASGAPREANLAISTLPSPTPIVTQGVFGEPDASLAGGYAETQNVTWLFHLILESKELSLLQIDRVDARFTRAGRLLWQETFYRDYLKRLEWLSGRFDMTPEYYLTKVLHGQEVAAAPDIPAGGTISWVRIPFARVWFARADAVEMTFDLKAADGSTLIRKHTVQFRDDRQKVTLRLPFDGIWAVNAGNDLTTGHRRTGLNGLTSYAWDFVKLGPDGMPYRTDGKTPQDYYTYGEPVYAAAEGRVVDMRNDISDYGIGEAPPADILRKDGDVFCGNFTTIDHNNGEFSLTSHMLAGSIPVKVGDHVKAGQLLGRVGNTGFSGVPHIHFNLMDGPKWLQARGVPSLFTNFERIRTGGPPQKIALGNPMSAWVVRNVR